jgi:hypothetical protein
VGLTEAPTPAGTHVVPAGYTINYFTDPRRYYEIEWDEEGDRGDGQDGMFEVRHEAVSVTTVLGCLDKPALPWWGMNVGVLGTLELVKKGVLFPATVPGTGTQTLGYLHEGHTFVATPEIITKLLTEHKLTVNHVRDTAAERGQTVHDAFEAWGAVGTIPNPDDFPLEQRGFVRSFLRFIEDVGDKFVVDRQEVMVGSKQHLFAGRYDVRAHTTGEIKVVTSALTTKGEPRKRGPIYTTIPGGINLLGDVKTSKGIYGSHMLQLEAYEGASVESGFDPTQARGVIHFTDHGLYEFRRARASYEDFLAVLSTYRAMARVEESMKL